MTRHVKSPRHNGILAVAILLVAMPVAGQTLDPNNLPSAGYRDANRPASYPPGVNDPASVNPAPPPAEAAVPLPPLPEGPLRSAPATAPLWTPSGPASANSSGVMPAAYVAPISAPADQTQVYPTVPAPPDAALRPASWYTRIDYFHWNERIAGADFVNEGGAIFTLGYQRRVGIERFRGELFGGDVHYDGYGQFGNGTLETLPSNTGYLGLRGEYELLYEPAAWQGYASFMLGVGSRFWIRDLHDGTTDLGTPVYGYEESWWTIYPYLGFETHSSPGGELDFYTESRVGMTAITYDYATIGDRPLWPRPGVVANLELGLRGERFYMAVRGEVMSWEASSVVQDAYQPHVVMYTVGGRLGIMF